MLFMEILETIKGEGRDIQRVTAAIASIDGILVHMLLKFVKIETSGIRHHPFHLIEHDPLEYYWC